MDNIFDLEGRVAVVTGAAGHLGKSMASALCQAGAKVYLNGRRAKALDSLRDVLEADGGSVEVAAFDVTDDAAIGNFIDGVAERDGKLDIIVNNAFTGNPGTAETATVEDFHANFDTIVTGAFRLIQSGRPLLKAAARMGSASVINIGSMYGTVSPDPRIYQNVPPNPPFYGAAKAGLLQLTRYLACEFAADGIRVNAISPGPFPSNSVCENAPEFVAELERRVPLARIGRPDDLRGAILFLASDASAYVTGINLPVDGGWTVW